MNALTRALSGEGSPDGIRANTMLPSLVDTPGTRATLADGRFEFVESIAKLGRVTTPEDVGYAGIAVRVTLAEVGA